LEVEHKQHNLRNSTIGIYKENFTVKTNNKQTINTPSLSQSSDVPLVRLDD